MTSPTVSIIVPAYNVAPYLSQCVDSVLHQTFADYELLLVDDGSTDNTPALCDAYAARDARIHVIHQSNEGLSGARNTGLSMARGELVSFLDGDDWLEPETLAVSVQAALDSQVDLVLWPYVREYDGVSLPKRLFQFDHRLFDAQGTRDLVCRRMVGLLGEELRSPENADALVTAWSKLYRRDLVERSGATFTDTATIGTEDALFNLQVITHASSAVYINRFLHHYRRDNASSLTTVYKAALGHQWDTLHELMRQHIDRHSLGADFEQALRNRISFSILGLGLNALNSGLAPQVIIKDIRGWLSAAEYREAVRTLELRCLPAPWRLFFTAAKYRQAEMVWVLLWTINSLRARRNRACYR